MTFVYFDGETEFSRLGILLDLCSCLKDEAQENPGAVLNDKSKESEDPSSNTWKSS